MPQAGDIKICIFGFPSFMKTVVIGQPSGAPMEQIMQVYPRHKTVVDKFTGQGVVIGIGPFTDFGNSPSSKPVKPPSSL